MESMPFRSRLVQLMQRSRKALRLYSSVERLPGDNTSELAELQVSEWRRVNSELLKELNLAISHPNQKRMVSEVFGIRDQFYGEWKLAEAEMHQKQQLLLEASENGDFVRASVLARDLVTLKSRTQACQAAHHEVQEVIKKGRVSQPRVSDKEELDLPEKEPTAEIRPTRQEIRVAKVIPLRKGMS